VQQQVQQKNYQNLTEAMESTATQVIAALAELGVPYETIAIDPAYADTTAFCAHYNYPLTHSGNTIIVASKKLPKQFVACVVLGTTQLDVNRRVKQLMGVSRASFATAEEMHQLTGMQVGGVTPFALPADLPLYVDERLMHLEWVILGGGDRTLKIKIAPLIFTRLGAHIVTDLAIEKPL
jgi:prolyl-tRNA editing enzyme YbaK/EbsC (Cys-tRNA(Pro) deacylase)